MHIDATRFPTTADGYPYRILATDLGGDLPIVIHVNGEIARLNADLQCPANGAYSLTEPRRTSTRYINFYRAADSSFTPGSKAHESNEHRRSLSDTARAIFALEVTFDENTGAVTARPV